MTVAQQDAKAYADGYRFVVRHKSGSGAYCHSHAEALREFAQRSGEVFALEGQGNPSRPTAYVAVDSEGVIVGAGKTKAEALAEPREYSGGRLPKGITVVPATAELFAALPEWPQPWEIKDGVARLQNPSSGAKQRERGSRGYRAASDPNDYLTRAAEYRRAAGGATHRDEDPEDEPLTPTERRAQFVDLHSAELQEAAAHRRPHLPNPEAVENPPSATASTLHSIGNYVFISPKLLEWMRDNEATRKPVLLALGDSKADAYRQVVTPDPERAMRWVNIYAPRQVGFAAHAVVVVSDFAHAGERQLRKEYA